VDGKERVERVMTDFLLELRSEEIPARMQLKAKDDLVRLFTDALAKAGLSAANIEAFATPRRLALIAKGLPLQSEPLKIETKGPRVSAPPEALEGFLRRYQLTREQLVERDGVYFAERLAAGQLTGRVLQEAIPAIIRAFPWPKSQRWGAASVSTESLRWVRPLQGIIALLGDDVVDCEIDGIVSGRTTMGHRFHSSGSVSIANADAYVEALRAAHVIVHYSERTAIIREGAAAEAKAAGLVLVPDEGLVTENAGLTEWPVPMLGRFDPAFLSVPQEVIQLTARVNQKYFVCNDADGKLANAFVCTANISAHDGGAAIVAGNEKVLAARLSDAKFFWEQDLKVALESQAEKLSQITFHEKLGTVADKVERVAKLARWLVEEGVISPLPSGEEGAQAQLGKVRAASEDPHPSATASLPPSPDGRGNLAAQAERAARLCKADLVTGMVGEFPELQGIMGGYYARAQGEPDAVADAIRDHYKPVGQGDDVPTAPVTVAVSLADKLDNMLSFLSIDLGPTGSKDPFALRRAMIGITGVLTLHGIRVNLTDLILRWIANAYDVMRSDFDVSAADNQLNTERNFQLKAIFDLVANQQFGAIRSDVIERLRPLIDPGKKPRFDFWLEALNRGQGDDWSTLRNVAITSMADRLKVQQREAGVRHDLIDAVFALGGEDDLVRLLARVKALQAFVATVEGGNLLAGYKRTANILKSSGDGKGTVPREAPWTVPGGTVEDSASNGTVPIRGQSPAEVQLLTALNTAEPLAAAAIEAEHFEDAMAALASLRAPIDAFFDGVMVNDPDPEKRAFRVGLLTRFRDAVHRVADFSRIEG
jgi:glycyl-tRNA synthetase beta chain